MVKTKSNNALHLTASIIAIVIVALTLLIGIGEMFEGQKKPGPGLDNYTIITFVVWAIGLAGLLLAIWKRGMGGLISFISIIIFNILVAVNPNPESMYTPMLLIFLLPSILFIISWWQNKSS